MPPSLQWPWLLSGRFDFHKSKYGIRQKHKAVGHPVAPWADKFRRDTAHLPDRFYQIALQMLLFHAITTCSDSPVPISKKRLCARNVRIWAVFLLLSICIKTIWILWNKGTTAAYRHDLQGSAARSHGLFRNTNMGTAEQV